MRLNLKGNAVWLFVEVIATGMSLLFLYKYVVLFLGIKALGIWSLVLATTSLAKLVDVGASSGLSRFIALALARKDGELAREYLSGALFINACLYSILALLLYWPLVFVIHFAVPTEAEKEATELLPYALTSFVFLNLGSTLLSALVGCQRADLKSKVVIFGNVLQIGSAILLVPSLGLAGLALAQLVQYVFSIAVGLFAVTAVLGTKVSRILIISRASVVEILMFGLKLQAANLVAAVFEPASKFAVSSIAGLELLGLFEMAYRMVFQMRATLAAPMQVLLPAFTHLQETADDKVQKLYSRVMAHLLICSVPLFAVVASASPWLGILWIGSYQQYFTVCTISLSVGWFINLVGMPAYLLGISSGVIRWNLIGHVLTSIGGPLLGIAAGNYLGPTGSVFGISAMLGLGMVFTITMNCISLRIRPLPTLREIACTITDYYRTGLFLISKAKSSS